MANRLIKSSARTSALQLADCLQSLFALELLAPSKEVYLISPWITDMPLLPNRFGQFRSLMPDLGLTSLSLLDLLTTFSERGATIRILYRARQRETEESLARLPASIERRSSETLHEKGLVTAHFYLRGSMNFTYFGANLNDESVELTTDPEAVALALVNARRRWEELGK